MRVKKETFKNKNYNMCVLRCSKKKNVLKDEVDTLVHLHFQPLPDTFTYYNSDKNKTQQ